MLWRSSTWATTPELISFIKSMKNEGDFIALLEAVLQTLAR